jgi:hypothetical protein
MTHFAVDLLKPAVKCLEMHPDLGENVQVSPKLRQFRICMSLNNKILWNASKQTSFKLRLLLFVNLILPNLLLICFEVSKQARTKWSRLIRTRTNFLDRISHHKSNFQTPKQRPFLVQFEPDAFLINERPAVVIFRSAAQTGQNRRNTMQPDFSGRTATTHADPFRNHRLEIFFRIWKTWRLPDLIRLSSSEARSSGLD